MTVSVTVTVSVNFLCSDDSRVFIELKIHRKNVYKHSIYIFVKFVVGNLGIAILSYIRPFL